MNAAVLAFSTSTALDAVALVLGGTGWITGLGLLGAAYQSEMAGWVKARGMAYYLIAFQGSNAIGGLAFGAVAQGFTLSVSLWAVAAVLVAAVVVTVRLSLPATDVTDLSPGEPWPLPDVDPAAERGGPVMVLVTWPVRADAESTFVTRSRDLKQIRSRTGGTSWRLYRDSDGSLDLLETYVVGSWLDHERQHTRMSVRDLGVIGELEALLRPGESRHVEHYLAVGTG